jgi:DNA-binding transcriptional ArsR family regulator
VREDQIVEALRTNEAFADLPEISVESISFEAGPPDLAMTLNVGGRKVALYGELKSNCSPLRVAQIAPWLRQLKQGRPDAGVAIICPNLSPESQRICIENGIDFIDLAGNVSIRIPGSLYIYRTGRKRSPETESSLLRDPFSGRASRILRVLLEKPRPWRTGEIAEELRKASQQFGPFDFNVSIASVSKTLKSLNEQLLVRRQDSTVLVLEPKKLLLAWADKYRERYKWRMRSAYKIRNPFGDELSDVSQGLRKEARFFAFTGVAAASREAPYVDLSTIDVLIPREAATMLSSIEPGTARGTDLRIVTPYDLGVFLYSRNIAGIPIVSPVQVFLDLYARGGRDLKQAEYYLSTVLEPRWRNQ